MSKELGPDNTDSQFIRVVERHLGAGCPARDDLMALVDHVRGVMNHWCHIVGMEVGQDMREFPAVLRKLMAEKGGV